MRKRIDYIVCRIIINILRKFDKEFLFCNSVTAIYSFKFIKHKPTLEEIRIMTNYPLKNF